MSNRDPIEKCLPRVSIGDVIDYVTMMYDVTIFKVIAFEN